MVVALGAVSPTPKGPPPELQSTLQAAQDGLEDAWTALLGPAVAGPSAAVPLGAPAATSVADDDDEWGSLLGVDIGGGSGEVDSGPMTARTVQALHDLSGGSGGFGGE